MATRRGKPCGASHIANSKVCRVGMPTAVNKAINAAAGEVGAATLKAAVQKHAGGAGVKRLREIRREIREEMGGIIVKGPRADELKKRLQEEGLLPPKAKSAAPKIKEDAPKPLSKPDPLYGAWPTDQLNKFRAGVDEDNPRFEGMRKQIDAELARRKEPAKPAEKAPDPVRDWKIQQLQDKRQAAWALGKDDIVKQIDEDLGKLGVKAEKPIVASAKTKAAIQSARAFDKDMAREQLRRDGDQSFNKWDETTESGAKKLGQGSFGTVIKSQDGSYAVKRGDISETEGKILQKLGEADLGPKLIAADVDGPANMAYSPGVNTRRGRIAMSIVDGKPIGMARPDDKIGGERVADAYWRARANLHRMGIAHNDMHIDNVLVDGKGKGRFVDLGLSQDNPKAALAEAMGAFEPPRGALVRMRPGQDEIGDWQVKQWRGTGGYLLADVRRGMPGARDEVLDQAPVLARVLDNKNALQYRMQKDGYTKDDIAAVMTHGIRSDPSTYNKGVWSRLSNEQAKEYIDILYDGV